MIDTAKTVGTAETFDDKKIGAFLSEGVINSIPDLERAIFSLEYVGQLIDEGLNLIFKGGSAVQVLLGGKWTRLSVDIDICTDSTEEELRTVLQKIHEKFDKAAFSYSPRDRKIGGKVPFYLYRIETLAITEKSRTILLDAMGMKPKFSTLQIPLKTSFFNSSTEVTIPTIGALLGDKLSTIGPTTIGRQLNNSRNGLEYAKHFYDINRLQEADFNLDECAKAFNEAIEIQSKIRNRDFSPHECFDDMLLTCQVASLSQQIGDEVIEKLQGETRSRAHTEFKILVEGLGRFRPFLVQKLTYAWDDLRSYAAQTALLVKIINGRVPEKKAKAILREDLPAKKEEIANLVRKIKSLPEKDRWFIELDEIVNFPRVLKTWHDHFFIQELI
jgi:predicted nucleotidyltransferase component of viral defense system